MSETDSAFPVRDYLHPKYWPTWVGLGLLRLIAYLPYPLLLRLGQGIGLLGYALLPPRRRIVRTNLRLVFPEHDDKTLRRLTRENFISSAMALLESALAWWGSDRKLNKLYRIEGLEYLQEAEARGKGVFMLGGHYTTLEISGRFLANHMDNLRPTYKRAHNLLFETVMVHQRRKMTGGLIPSRDMRAILRNLKQGKAIWYAPDQDFGMNSSVFAPFMGVQTATLTLTARIAQSSGAPMLPFYSERLPGTQGYLIRFGPIIEAFPTGDDVTDATLVNQAIEQQVCRTPGQYLWAHRRFKTRPHGEPQIYKVRRSRHMRRYSYALALLSLPIVLYTIWIALRNRDRRYLVERLGFGRGNIRAQIYLHAASIGEFNAALPLIRRLKERYPDQRVLVSTNTPSSQQLAYKQLGDSVAYSYLPIDWYRAMQRHLRRIRPDCVLIMETELWPNLYDYCYQHGIHNIIINGRLSERSTRNPYTIRYWLSQTIQKTYMILARTPEDEQHFRDLGAGHIKCIGNIKYSAVSTGSDTAIDPGRPYVLAASTRNDEEKLIVEQWLKTDAPRPLLVIVPRHIQRLKSILADLRTQPVRIAVRSRGDTITDDIDVYIADTFGELGQFIAGSQFVIMGGSFKPFGGQNILEVAQQGKAVLFGPDMKNFQAEARDLLDAGGAIQIDDPRQLGEALNPLLKDTELRQRLGEAARQLIDSQRDMAERYLGELQQLCAFNETNR